MHANRLVNVLDNFITFCASYIKPFSLFAIFVLLLCFIASQSSFPSFMSLRLYLSQFICHTTNTFILKSISFVHSFFPLSIAPFVIAFFFVFMCVSFALIYSLTSSVLVLSLFRSFVSLSTINEMYTYILRMVNLAATVEKNTQHQQQIAAKSSWKDREAEEEL